MGAATGAKAKLKFDPAEGWVEIKPGRWRLSGKSMSRASNLQMKSMAMGCAVASDRAKRLLDFNSMGIDAHYHPETCELVFDGGFQAQKRLAKYHGLEVG